ncbi:MAG: NYN domain-containing protein [Candidatus ainarchaeum sp.]|nr:NYN domain-containing protein [Candidatus ainarchaeum sp.]
MQDTFVFIDAGFLDKLALYLGDGQRIKFDLFCLAKNLSKNQNLFCKKLFYYNAPPFQSSVPTEDEKRRKQGYDKFIEKISRNKNIIIREGRCQKTFDENGKPKFVQKGVDTLITMDLSELCFEHKNIKKIILVSSDTDFCPIIKKIKEKGIEVILYSYFNKERHSKFSLSNELIDCCSSYFKIEKNDLLTCKLG